jgi:flagellar hook-associated protein FlgK
MIIKDFIKNKIRENLSDYVGQHSAPSKDGNEPMHNIEDMFPDMYSDKALRYYGGYGLDDASVINQIQTVHNKPNKLVKIYRAVPNLNKEVDKQIKELVDLLNYRFRYRFFPVNNKIIHNIEDKVQSENPNLTYDETQQEIVNELNKMIDELRTKKEKPLKINNGDWVTTSLLYAKEHGRSHLNNNFKIVSKTVKASELYTDGNSIFEWGYNV